MAASLSLMCGALAPVWSATPKTSPISPVRASFMRLGRPLALPQVAITAQDLAELKAAVQAAQAAGPQTPAARILAAAIADRQFIGQNRQALEALIGRPAILNKLEAKAQRLDAEAAQDPALAAAVESLRAEIGAQALTDLSAVIKVGAAAFDGQAAAGDAASPAAVGGEVPALRRRFNAAFTPRKYKAMLDDVAEGAGVTPSFRIAETPVFFERGLLEKMARYGTELLRQLDNPEYFKAAAAAIPAEFNVPRETPHPLFVAVDFGLVKDAEGNLQPKLVEMQGFPSVTGLLDQLAQSYTSAYGLKGLNYLLSGLDREGYHETLRRAILGKHDPKNVVLLEIDPLEQKTLIDFELHRKVTGVKILNIRDVKKRGRKLYYEENGKLVPIRRIFNRVIVDELVRKNVKPPFNFTDDLDVEWADHPNWYFRISKFSLPFLRHESVPQSWFLDQVKEMPTDLENWVLKPLFSFSGLGVKVGPTAEDIAAIPPEQRSQYLLQRRMDFVPFVDTPAGPTKAEVRIMYVWLDKLVPVISLVRLGRGLLMGVDYNKQAEWIGASVGLFQDEASKKGKR